MVRKRSWAERARMKHTRPKTPAPKNGWLLSELASLTGFSETTLRYYCAQKLIQPIQRRGTATRYARRELMLLLGFVRLKNDESSTLAEKKRKLEDMGSAEFERWLREGPLPEPAAQALGLGVASVPSPARAEKANDACELDETRFEHWQRLPLLPGLDLMLRANASKAARAAAQQIYAQYVATNL